jgi:ribosomal protein L37AE/L43A
MRATCDVCAEDGEVRIDGDAYVCTRCDADYAIAAEAAAKVGDTSYDVAVKMVDAYHQALDEANESRPELVD